MHQFFKTRGSASATPWPKAELVGPAPVVRLRLDDQFVIEERLIRP
jgi:hypothetical protein